ncbi:methyltransferase [Pseudarthrobacter sp. J64]|uniref:class I SAM-dependent methyltransferase n=1 Tax=Pseudarthrobacter sp. J64 TaxID=3116485 RepID=UPI002E8072A0|nr:methyltransferase [Pseudarthrobacter sp. J64]MEE2568664.1 methyltransferase [Pseudarthrobacter sp. J64]
MTDSLQALFDGLRRFPDVEAANLQAWDATDRLLLDAAWELPAVRDASTRPVLAVIGDRYGALTLGALARSEGKTSEGAGPGEAATGFREVRVHQDLCTGVRALGHNAAAAGLGGWRQLPLGEELLAGADVVLLQLPKTLAELEEIAEAVARWAGPAVTLVAGGRVKHMSLGMNAVLERYFGRVQPQLARQKSRLVIAAEPVVPEGPPGFPVLEYNQELDLHVAARGAVFAGTRLDIGTRYLLTFLPEMAAVDHAVDLGCGTGILGSMYARQNPGSKVTATDQSAAAVDSARATAAANGLAGQVDCLQDDALSTMADGSAGLVLLNPPFHLGNSVHAGAGLKMIEAAGRVLRPGGQLWTVFNSHLSYLPALRRTVGPTSVAGRNSKFTVALSVRTER